MCLFTSYVRIPRFYSCDIDLDSMTFTYEFDSCILKMYPDTKNEVSRSRLLKIRPRTGQADRHTDRHADRCIRNNNDAAFVGGRKADERKKSKERPGSQKYASY